MEGVVWIIPAQDLGVWHVLENTVVDFAFLYNAETFFAV
jgi:hypothetical protein